MKLTFTFILILLISPKYYSQFDEATTLNDSWSGVRYVSINDIDDDSNLDIVVALTSDLYYFPNPNGDANFDDPIKIDTDINRPNCVQTGDIDNDGDLDLLISSGDDPNFHRVLWMENDGMGNYEYNEIIDKDDGVDHAFHCLLVDLDNDSDLDIVVNSFDSDEFYILKNDGSGNFGNMIILETEDRIQHIETIDINGDGHQEIFYVSYQNNLKAFGYYLSEGSNSYQQVEIGGLTGSNANQFDFFDIDADGDLDLIGQTYNGEEIGYYENYGNGDFESNEIEMWTADNSWEGGKPVYFYIYESNGKNNLNFFTHEGIAYTFPLDINSFPATPVKIFEQEDFKFFEDELNFVDHGDLNGDGLPDIAYTEGFSNPVFYRLFQSVIVDSDNDGFDSDVDCDDNNANVNPGQTEIVYNGIDDDCDDTTLDDDLDQDGFGMADDCDDNNPNVYPSAIEEIYNGIDDDCNPATLDDDLDQDGFLLADDCDDNNNNINPDAPETPYNGIDDDCDATTVDDDLDGDGFLLADDCDDNNANANPNGIEIPDNMIDEDCDGMDLTSIHELANASINIYPNPAEDIINVDITGNLNYFSNLYDLDGKLILSSKNQGRINVQNLPRGIYLLEIKDQLSGQKIIERIVKGK